MDRAISFTIDGEVDTLITVTELGDGTLRFDIEVLGSGSIGDLRAIFFDLEGVDVQGAGYAASGLDVNSQTYGENSVDRVNKDANINGEVVKEFGDYDAGVEFGTSGMSADDIQSTSFILSNNAFDLTLDMISGADFGIRYTSVGDLGGSRSGSTKQGWKAIGAAQNDAFSAVENGSGSLNLLANDDAGAPGALSQVMYGGSSYLANDPIQIILNGLEIGTLTVNGAGEATFLANGADVDLLAEGQVETFSFGYESSETVDGFAQTASAMATVTVSGKNDAPTLAAGVLAASEDGPVAELDLSALGDDVDADDDGASLTYSVSAPPALGAASISGTTLTFDPSGDFEGLAAGETQDVSIEVTATDSHGQGATNTVVVTVTGDNDAPTLAAGTLAASEDGPSVTLDLSALGDDIDSDDDGSTLTYALTGAPVAGLASISGTTLTFDPDGAYEWLGDGETTEVALEVTTTDAHGLSATNEVTITIVGQNDAPSWTKRVVLRTSEANEPDPQSFTIPGLTFEDPDLLDQITATANFKEAIWSGGKISLAQQAAIATPLLVTANPGNTNVGAFNFTYSVSPDAIDFLNAGTSLLINYEVTLTDDHGASHSQTIGYNIAGRNDAPTLASGLMTVSEDGPSQNLNLAALGDDPDKEDSGATLTYAISGGPSAGLASISGTTLTFDPVGAFESLALGQVATETIEITATDAQGESVTNTVEVEITGENDAPTLIPQTKEVHEDSGPIYTAFEEIADDPDSDDTPWSLSYAIVSQPAAGAASIIGTSVMFDPQGDFEDLALGETRDVVVQVSATDQHGAATTADMTYTVTGRNDAPTLAAGVLSFMEDGPAGILDLSTLGDDIDSDDDSATLTYAIGLPNQGIATLTGTILSFDPNGTREWLNEGQVYDHGMWVFATDSHGEQVRAYITLSGIGQNDAPTLAAGTLAALEDGPDAILDLASLGDDIDLEDDGTTLSYAITSGPAAGLASITGTELTFSANGEFEHLAEGATQEVVLEVTATDAQGASAINEVTVTVTGENDAPRFYFLPASLQTAPENSFSSLPVASFWDDPDSDDTSASLNYAIVSQPAEGQAMIVNQQGLQVNFIDAYGHLDEGETAQAIIGLSATDVHGATTTGDLIYTISGVNDAPIITGGQTTGTVTEDGTLVASGALTATPGDANDTISWSIQGGGTGAYGAMTLDQGGNWSYQLDNDNTAVQALDSGESLTDSFVFEVLDDDGLSVTETIDITIEGADDGSGNGVFSAAFVTGSAKPWNATSYVTNMNTVFGNSWDDLSSPTENIFDDGYDFLWIDGGDGQTNWFQDFVNNWRPEMEQYVSDGGTLLLNAARWSDQSSFYLGFGATLQFGYSTSANATGAAAPITNGAYGNAGTYWTGGYFAHDYVSGAGFSKMLVGQQGDILVAKAHGDGQVALGGMTASQFHSSRGDILEQNILDYTASYADDYAFL